MAKQETFNAKYNINVSYKTNLKFGLWNTIFDIKCITQILWKFFALNLKFRRNEKHQMDDEVNACSGK